MLFIDQISKAKSLGKRKTIKLLFLSSQTSRLKKWFVNISGDIEGGHKGSERSFTATLGLVVHAAVDGVALGAAATTAHADVEMIVFVAIMLHKVSCEDLGFHGL